MTEGFQHVCNHFNVLALRLSFRLERDGELPAFKGSMWHGWLGQALKRFDEHSYFVLFHEHASGQPKPYAVVVEDDKRCQWHRGELLHMTLYLYAEACQLVDKVLGAVQAGGRLGLGKSRIPVQLLSVASATKNGLQPGCHIQSLSDWLVPGAAALHGETALEFISPLRMKVAQRQLTQAPQLGQLCLQIKRRLTLLTRYWLVDDMRLTEQLQQALPVLGDHEFYDFTYVEDWQRYSNKQQAQLPFGGLKGQVSFSGEISEARPWLQLGEVLGIGGKTTFGLGRYRLIA
ncbi:CRISPR system precrRNA processing endoribonuclease RAMP protein Cas6 [Pseudoalteromonas rubra]|uniref:CRISPR system precrRNA processing endoribonuclease RAMP protein Cas6 n=1 Tax=Pseudoalteromonas rubra TaxID=43658 RepID=UPI000F7B834F|nr:CRISPR system precrRNA processing endoribonuclease RAMP protein Cas6 [Pseudoalteromonas rubra]